MNRLTPQDAHQESRLLAPGLPEEWDDLTVEEQAMFAQMAHRLNAIVNGEVITLPSRKKLINEHRREIDKLKNKPVMIGSWRKSEAERIMDDAMDKNVIQYHELALRYLESGGDRAETVDAMTDEEVIEVMRSQLRGWPILSTARGKHRQQNKTAVLL